MYICRVLTSKFVSRNRRMSGQSPEQKKNGERWVGENRLNRLDWSIEAEEYEARTENLISKWQKVLADIVSVPTGKKTFKNTVKPMLIMEAESMIEDTMLTFPQHVSACEKIREKSTISEKKLAEYYIEAGMRKDVFDAMKEYAESPEVAQLEAEDRRALEFILRDFKRNGLGLNVETRQKVEELSKQISDMSITFQKNVTEDKSCEWFTLEQLAGLAEDFISELETKQEKPESVKLYKIT